MQLYIILYAINLQYKLHYKRKSDRADTKILIKLEMYVEQIPLGQKTK